VPAAGPDEDCGTFELPRLVDDLEPVRVGSRPVEAGHSAVVVDDREAVFAHWLARPRDVRQLAAVD
jgi:hypothetical protein